MKMHSREKGLSEKVIENVFIWPNLLISVIPESAREYKVVIVGPNHY